jgi:hypothetical protein
MYAMRCDVMKIMIVKEVFWIFLAILELPGMHSPDDASAPVFNLSRRGSKEVGSMMLSNGIWDSVALPAPVPQSPTVDYRY